MLGFRAFAVHESMYWSPHPTRPRTALTQGIVRVQSACTPISGFVRYVLESSGGALVIAKSNICRSNLIEFSFGQAVKAGKLLLKIDCWQYLLPVLVAKDLMAALYVKW